ncbi:hypothetical protein Patl1_28804 [Pistacia atlantica]|uniref:Uncharacterized protein n=1 Tax=Pistacia atlantica TaxID=434234 RepID=A0ACC1BG96_9ROSI|nr:hypothetical protein Patl1_28804 [Pistacia atlantica]
MHKGRNIDCQHEYYTCQDWRGETSRAKFKQTTVSVPVVELHGIRLKPDIMLLDQNGDKLPVKVAFRSNDRIARLKIGDKCVFEFVLSRGNIYAMQ